MNSLSRHALDPDQLERWIASIFTVAVYVAGALAITAA